MWTVSMIGVGVLIGWNLPQPAIAKTAQTKFVAWAKEKWNAWKK